MIYAYTEISSDRVVQFSTFLVDLSPLISHEIDLDVFPDPNSTWDVSGSNLVPGVRNLTEARLHQEAQINAWRLQANRTSFTFAGKEIACDELSRSDIDGTLGKILLTGAFPAGWPGGWKAIDNTYVTITDLETWTAFFSAMVDQGSANFAYSQLLKADVAAATTTEEVEAIVWSFEGG